MAISARARLGPYEILSLAGTGGMGEVYKACDTRLDRIVAIKVLPSRIANDPAVRERFEREARAVAALNHPGICTLYDIGHQDGLDFLVLEYLEGETMAARLQRGTLPIDQLLHASVEIADALDRAHRHGIIHRDLKPSNIMLTKGGIKLLDFGLAKVVARSHDAVGISHLPTAQPDLTAAGVILGTFQYMAPEQLEGRETDARTDIFALGVVMYEMATGRRAFEGNSQASLAAAILRSDPPPMRTLQPLAPPMLERVVRKCLAKDPEHRWQTARDVTTELQSIDSDGPEPATGAPLASTRAGRERWAWAVAAFFVVSTIALAFRYLVRPMPLRTAVRFSVAVAADAPLVVDWGSPPAISADGRQIAYVGVRPDGTTQIYLRALDQFEASAVHGTEDGTGPFFSPNGQWLGFFSGGKLKKVAIAGGPPITLCDGFSRGASWGADDTIIFTRTYNGGLFRVSAAGGTPTAVTTIDPRARERSHRWPHFLPGGKAILFTAGAIDFDEAEIVARSLDTAAQHVVLQGGTSPHYAATGHLVFARAGSILAAPFDIGRLEATGPSMPVVENVATARLTGTSHFSISPAGALVYTAGPRGPSDNTLLWVDRQGVARPVAEARRAYTYVRISPDGQRVALIVGDDFDKNQDVWILEVARGTLTRFTFGPGLTQEPIWSPDGKQVTYTMRTTSKSTEVLRKAADGSGADEPLLASGGSLTAGSWSPDGKWLAFHDEASGILVLPMDGSRKPKPFAVTFKEDQPQFSPDGRWIAYRSFESGRSEVYVRPFPGPGGKWQVSTDGGSAPIWNRNGRELFYRSGDRLMAVAVSLGQTFAAGTPLELFRGPYFSISNRESYDVAPDGQHFLMIRREQSPAPAHLNVVLDWFTELARVTASPRARAEF